MPGSILGQYSVIRSSNINYSARATSETNMLVISIETINKLEVENPELTTRVKSINQMISRMGMPLLDYYCLRKKPKLNVLSE